MDNKQAGNHKNVDKRNIDLGDFVTFGYPKFKVANGVWGRLILLQNDRFEFVISITDKLRAEDLRNAWGSIDETREQLRKNQGSEIRLYSVRLLLGLTYLKEKGLKGKDRKERGWSYNDIARELNFDCIVFLCQYADRDADEKTRGHGAMEYFSTLRAMHMNMEDILELYLSGISLIREGQAPWRPNNEPITWLRVRDSIRQFKKEISNGKIVINDMKYDGGDLIIYRWLARIKLEYAIQAIKLLSKTYPTYWENFGYQHAKRIFRVKDTLEESG